MNVLGNVAAGTTFDGEYRPYTCVAIATGAPVPECFDAVVQHELTASWQWSRDVSLRWTFSKGKSIHPQGVDAKEGEVLVSKTTQLYRRNTSALQRVWAMLILKFFTKPRVVVVSSGDEVVSPSSAPFTTSNSQWK